MNVKTKKLFRGRVVRIEGDGEIKEVFSDTDILNPEEELIQVCFRGKDSSGIVELSSEEAEHLCSTLSKIINFEKGIKVSKTKSSKKSKSKKSKSKSKKSKSKKSKK